MDNDILEVGIWIQYAQEGYDCAVEIAKTNNPYAARKASYDCQQSAEKILKAYVIAQKGTRYKEHNLLILLKQCSQYSSDFNNLNMACSVLSMYITATRYPSNVKLTKSDMEQALKYASQILEFTKSKLKELKYEYVPEQAEE